MTPDQSDLWMFWNIPCRLEWRELYSFLSRGKEIRWLWGGVCVCVCAPANNNVADHCQGFGSLEAAQPTPTHIWSVHWSCPGYWHPFRLRCHWDLRLQRGAGRQPGAVYLKDMPARHYSVSLETSPGEKCWEIYKVEFFFFFLLHSLSTADFVKILQL